MASDSRASGAEARWITFRLDYDPFEQLILHAETVIGESAYLVTYIGLSRRDDEYRSEFESIVASLDLED